MGKPVNELKHYNALKHYIEGEAAMVALGEALGRAAATGATVFLEGTLGAGKTTLSRGVLRAFGYSGAVKSPTYTLVEPYEFAARKVYHFDLYRLGDPEELEFMGIRDYFAMENLCLVEWPERGDGFLPEADLAVKVRVKAPGRDVTLQAHTPRGEAMLQRFASQISER